jgi:hypothetical protein
MQAMSFLPSPRKSSDRSALGWLKRQKLPALHVPVAIHLVQLGFVDFVSAMAATTGASAE